MVLSADLTIGIVASGAWIWVRRYHEWMCCVRVRVQAEEGRSVES